MAGQESLGPHLGSSDFLSSHFLPLISNYYIAFVRNSHFHPQHTSLALMKIKYFIAQQGFGGQNFLPRRDEAPGGSSGSWCHCPMLASCWPVYISGHLLLARHAWHSFCGVSMGPSVSQAWGRGSLPRTGRAGCIP